MAFYTSVLQGLIEELQQAHQDCRNSNNTPDIFQVGDIFKDYVQVYPNAKKGVLPKLSYQEQGPFLIIKDCGSNFYYIHI